MNNQQTEDLKAFENRLTECVTYASKKTLKWRGNRLFYNRRIFYNFAVLLIGATISTMMSFWSWIRDSSSYVRSPLLIQANNADVILKTSYLEMLYTHWWLLVNLSFMLLLYLVGACDKYSAPKL